MEKNTDLQNIVVMISKTDEPFEKSKSGDGWIVVLPNRNVQFYFNADGSFHFLYNTK